MKKTLVISLITVAIVVTSAVVWAFSPKKTLKPSEYHIGMKYEQAMKEQKPFIALFYADWCTYCIKFAPKYKILSDVYGKNYNIVMINVDDPESKKLQEEYAIGGLPTLYIIDPSIDNRVILNQSLYGDLRKVRTEIDRYSRIRAMIKK